MKIKIPGHIISAFNKYKYILLICIAGIILVLIPVKSNHSDDKTESAEAVTEGFDLQELEKIAESIFSEIDGVGKVKVIITVKSGFEKKYLYDEKTDYSKTETSYSLNSEKELVRISNGNKQEPIAVKIYYPELKGAVIVCEGGDNAKIKLELTQAMKSLTGISADNIVVAKMKD